MTEADKGERCAEIYRSKKSGVLLVQAYWAKPTGGSTFQGEPIALPASASDEDLGVAVFRALESFGNPFDASKCPTVSETAYRRLLREHDIVFIELWPTGETLVGPMKRSSGGLEGTRRTQRLPAGTSRSRVVAAIRKALAQAG